MRLSLRRALAAVPIIVILALACFAPSYAVNASAFLSGTVTSEGRPVAHVRRDRLGEQSDGANDNGREGTLLLSAAGAGHV